MCNRTIKANSEGEKKQEELEGGGAVEGAGAVEG